jgi:RecB family exonuclease
MNQTMQQIAEICRRHPLKEKLLFVPSYAIGHQIGEALVRIETPWLNLRMTTAGGFAQEVIALELAAAGRRLIDSRQRTLIVEALYRGAGDTGEAGLYFKDAQEVPGIVRCLSDAVHEMRMAGMEAADVDPAAFVARHKGEELAWLLKAYERFLEENRLVDHAGVLHRAVRKLGGGSRAQDRLVMVLSDFPLSHLEKTLIRTAGGEELIVIDHRRPRGLGLPGRFFEPAQQAGHLESQPASNIELLPWLFQPQEAPEPPGDESVLIFQAMGESNEVREVFRRILAEGIPIDDVELVISAMDPYVSMIHEIAAALDLPATFGTGIPVQYTRPGAALLLFLHWVREDFSAVLMSRLFSRGYLNMNALGDEAPIGPGKAATLLREAQIGWGKDRYSARLNVFVKDCRSRAELKREQGEEESALRLETEADGALWLQGFLQALLETVPPIARDNTVETGALYAGAREFLNRFARTAGALDGSAGKVLGEMLASLCRTPSFFRPLEEAVNHLEGSIGAVSVGYSGPEPGCVHVTHYRSGGYSGRAHTFFLGLDQNRFPGTLLQDPVLLDEDRKGLGTGLILSGELLEENTYAAARLLCSLRGRVTLSFPCRDLKEDREAFPSSLLLGAYRLISKDRKGDYRSLLAFLGDPVGFVPGAGQIALNDWEWWLARKTVGYENTSVYSSYPNLENGDAAQRERENEHLGIYDGYIPSVGEALDPLRAGRILSASRLEGLAACPFAYYIQHVLGIEPLEELEKDPSQWLSSLQRGELLHDVFYRFMAEITKEGTRPDHARHSELIHRIAQEEIDRWKDELPPPTELALRREEEKIAAAIGIFLRDEAERCKEVEPKYFELSFGLEGDPRSTLGSERPVKIPLGKGRELLLRGRIDRVNRCGDHEYEIWDYKTGSRWGYTEEGCFKQGKQLQHALYSLAAEQLLREGPDPEARVIRAGYFFTGDKGEGERIVRAQPRRELKEVLADLSALLRTGVFPSARDRDPCMYCPYDAVCGGADRAVQRSKAKMAVDEKLEPFRRLGEHG